VGGCASKHLCKQTPGPSKWALIEAPTFGTPRPKFTFPTCSDAVVAAAVRQNFVFDKVLGKGNFGIVHLVYDKVSSEPFACKSISKRKLVTQDDIDDVKREVQILSHLAGHPNVVQLRGTYEDKGYVHLVMELCEGGELFDRIADKGHFTERQAAEVVRTVVSVVHHCHTMNVIHRDLKPENFLVGFRNSCVTVQLFSSAAHVDTLWI